MFGTSHSSGAGRAVVALLCAILLLVRVGGPHLHLCFDGSEPPASFHAFDLAGHHGLPGIDASHDDADIALIAEFASGLDKRFDTVVYGLLTTAFLLALLQRPRQLHVRFHTEPRERKVPVHLRPPLRAPPRLASR